MRVVVIGAGFGGLSAAAHLIAAGHEVTVVEREARPGGRAASETEAGFTLDLGPTTLTMPDVLAEAFEAAGASMGDYVNVAAIDPIHRAVFADGSALCLRRDREAMTEEIRAFAGPREAGVFNEFCDWVTELHELSMPRFIDTNLDSVGGVVRRWRAVVDLARSGGFRRLDHKVASFFADERLRQLFSSQTMAGGVASHRAFALLSVYTYMDTVSGPYSVEGGLPAAAAGLADAIESAGATFMYKSHVARIMRDGSGVTTGVELGAGDRLVADAVICNADLPIAYRTLLGGVDAPRVARRGTYSPSCVVWAAGVSGMPASDVQHRNIHFADGSAASLDNGTKRGSSLSGPSMIVSVPSITDPTRAPMGCSTIQALEPVSNLDGKVDWVKDGARLTERLRQRVAAAGYPVTDVCVERVIDPLQWERQGLERGTPFALAHTRRQTGPLRPSNRDARVPGLFFAGSGTSPGVGVPMVLISGKLAAARVDEYARDTSTVRW